MTKAEIEEIKNIFDSIICLCVEGAELFSATKILNSICKEAEKGCDLVDRHLTPAALDSEGDAVLEGDVYQVEYVESDKIILTRCQ